MHTISYSEARVYVLVLHPLCIPCISPVYPLGAPPGGPVSLATTVHVTHARARIYQGCGPSRMGPWDPGRDPPGGSRGSPPGGRALALASSRGAAGTKDARSRNFGFAKGFDDDARWGFSRCCFWAVLLLWQYVVVVCSGSMWCVVLYGCVCV